MKQEPQKEREFMMIDSPEIRYMAEYGGTLKGLLQFCGVRITGFVDSAEGIRVPFDREKAKVRAERMRTRAKLDQTIDQILGDES